MPHKDDEPKGCRLLIQMSQGGRPRLYWNRNVYGHADLPVTLVGSEVVVHANANDTSWLDVYRASDRMFLGRFHRLGRIRSLPAAPQSHRPSVANRHGAPDL